LSRLLASWELGLGNGHITYLASAARGLGALGHQSWLAARDVVTPQVLADRPFDRVVQAPIWLRQGATGITRSYGQVIADAGFADDEGLIALVAAWLALFASVKPDAIYGEHAPASLLAAHVARLPAARLGTPFTCPVAVRPMPDITPWLAGDATAADQVCDRVVRAVCRHYGAPMLSGIAELLATATPFVASWPELSMPGAERRDSALYGPLTGIGAATAPDWPTTAGPRVFVYLPFEREMARPLAAALGSRGWPVIWVCTTPPGFALPDNIRHEVEPIDTALALRQATLLASRGGHGICLDAIRHGCPHLMLPDRVETRANALAVAAHGLGRLPPAWDAAAIGTCLDAMARLDAPEVAACAAAAARHAGYDAQAMTAQLGRDMAAALGLPGATSIDPARRAD
jgi:UDP:flavonoid glycosyltransferase YjiC (YdhE family)